MGSNKFGFKQILRPKNFGLKKIGSKKIRVQKIRKNVGSQKMLGSKQFQVQKPWHKQNLGPKNIDKKKLRPAQKLVQKDWSKLGQ